MILSINSLIKAIKVKLVKIAQAFRLREDKIKINNSF
jgi:hypothetical protein